MVSQELGVLPDVQHGGAVGGEQLGHGLVELVTGADADAGRSAEPSIVAMVPADPGVEHTPAAGPGLDPDSAEWLRLLAGTGPLRKAALARLHEMLVRIARGEVGRRAPRLRLAGPELDDLAYQAAADALIAITDARRKLRSALAANGYIGDG
jgi:hypothetical protein